VPSLFEANAFLTASISVMVGFDECDGLDTISDLSKVKEMLSKDREGTINILNEKYELTTEQRKELGL